MALNLNELLKLNTTKEIVDEMFNQFYTVRYEKYEKFKGKTFKTVGHYIKVVYDKDEHPFDCLARRAEKYVYEFYNNDRDKMNMEDFLQDIRLDLYEMLLKLANGNINGFEINNIDDFKELLQNKEESERAKAYILRSLKSNLYKRNMCEGKYNSSSSHTYGYRVQKDCKRKIIWKKIDWFFVDENIKRNDEDEIDENSVLDMHFYKIELEKNSDAGESIYKYILENKDNIFHKKQLDYLNYILSGGDIKEYRDTKYDTSQAHRFIVKKALEKLKNDKYVYIINNQLRIKQKDFLKTVEDIINAKNELEQFILIKSILCDDNTYVNSMFIDLIYGLDKRIIRDLVFCLTDTVDENWLKTDDFKTIIKVLIDEYNFQIKNQKLIYKYNVNQKISKEYKIKKYIEENCFFVEGQEFGLIAKSENDKGIPTLQQITDFINKVYNENFKKKEIRAFLITFGYDIDVYKRTSKNKVNCYKVFRSTQ